MRSRLNFWFLQNARKTAGKYRLYCNLGYNLHEEVVREYFQRYCTRGRILDVYIPRHSSGRNKGYGFTTFQHEADLDTALQVCRCPAPLHEKVLLDSLGLSFSLQQRTEHSIDGIIVKVNRAGPRPDYQPSLDEVRCSYYWQGCKRLLTLICNRASVAASCFNCILKLPCSSLKVPFY